MAGHFQKIDLAKWSRGELFRFYIEKMRIVMSLTVGGFKGYQFPQRIQIRMG